MHLAELLEQTQTIHQERTLEAHHDDMFFQTYTDVEALEKIILLLKFLEAKKPADKVKVADILKAAQIER